MRRLSVIIFGPVLMLTALVAISMLAILAVPMALAQTVSPPVKPIGWEEIKAFLTPETWAVVVFWIAGYVTSPLTALFKRWLGTHGPDTQKVNLVIVTLLTAVLPFALGAYGYTFFGLIYAIATATTRSLVDQGLYQRSTDIAAKAVTDTKIVVMPSGDIIDSALPASSSASQGVK